METLGIFNGKKEFPGRNKHLTSRFTGLVTLASELTIRKYPECSQKQTIGVSYAK